MENLDINCELPSSGPNRVELAQMLPPWRTKILEVRSRLNGTYEIKFQVAADTVEKVKEWIQAYEEQSECTYSITATENGSGRYILFKQRLHCQRRTKCSRTYDPTLRNKTRNTNCPSTMNITLRAIKKKYRGANKTKAPNPLMPCEIILIPTHNHSIHTADALRFRQVSMETKEKLLQLFERGHSPATALESLKVDIHLNFENFEEVLTDRRCYPSYNYCYYLYNSEFKKKYRPLECLGELQNSNLDQYNQETNENSDQVVFQVSDYDWLTPLFQKTLGSENQSLRNNNTNNRVVPSSSGNAGAADNLLSGEFNMEDVITEGRNLIKDISDQFATFLKKSPLEVTTCFKIMKQNINKLKTVSAFSTSCATFASACHRRTRGSRIPVQPTAIGRRKTSLSGKIILVGGRLRTASILTTRRKTHNLSNQMKKALLQ